MKLIVGLGNPGFKYRSTRHNIGFMVLDKIAAEFRIRVKRRIFDSLCGKGRIHGEEVILAKPLTYMNLSGKAVYGIKEKENINLEDLLVIMDDADLPLGKIRLRSEGSAGGHRGLRSIAEELGGDAFPRLRIGIGVPDQTRDLRDYVLTPFRRSEKGQLGDLTQKCSLCVGTWIKEGIETAMNRFNP